MVLGGLDPPLPPPFPAPPPGWVVGGRGATPGWKRPGPRLGKVPPTPPRDAGGGETGGVGGGEMRGPPRPGPRGAAPLAFARTSAEVTTVIAIKQLLDFILITRFLMVDGEWLMGMNSLPAINL